MATVRSLRSISKPAAALLLLLGLANTAPAAAAPSQQNGAVLERLAGWLAGSRSRRQPERNLDQLATILAQLRRSVNAGLVPGREACAGLIELAEAGLAAREDPRPGSQAWGREVLELSRTTLSGMRSEELVDWLAAGPLVMRTTGSPEERAATALLLAGEASHSVVQGLLTSARSSETKVREAALEALTGRDDELVHLLFASLVESSEPRARQLAERHFDGLRLGQESRATALLLPTASRELLTGGWREALAGLSLARSLPDFVGIPLLIDALELWGRRVESGGPYRRLQSALVETLEARCGRNIGLRHERWRAWWNAVLEGRLGSPAPDRPDQQRTTASFFGLAPQTDRVLFVIDRSGSMDAIFGSGGVSGRRPQTRYEEALEQMIGFLEGLGPRTHFGVVLFSDQTWRWHSKLAPATGGNLSRVRRWLVQRGPSGGTHLREGILRALDVDAQGRVDLDELEADTVIVLCDGQTAEGPGWVADFIQDVARSTRVVFHGVLIGSRGDGTLEALAAASGGQFVRVAR